jgi:hypothetical protein
MCDREKGAVGPVQAWIGAPPLDRLRKGILAK